MNLIVGHTNMDLDCIGSMVLARSLFPEHQPVRSHLIHPSARNLYNLFENHLRFLPSRELGGQRVERMVVVDTRTSARIREVLDLLPRPPERIEVFDHHPEERSDIPGAVLHEASCGANTTLLGTAVMERGLALSPEDATVALTGIFADTGRFTHHTVQAADFDVASYLMSRGASIKVVDHLLKALRDEEQVNHFHALVNNLAYRTVHGHTVALCCLELDRQVPGLAAVVEKAFEVENAEALFVVFSFPARNRSLIIARSGKDSIRVDHLLSPFGGGGHHQAASALVKGRYGRTVLDALSAYLEEALVPAVTAREIMSPVTAGIRRQWSLLEASRYLERVNHTGAPVVGAGRSLEGFLTLRDIMKGRKAGQMHAPVHAYMTREVVSIAPDTAVAEIEKLMYRHNVGHLPVIDGGRLVGIVTRTDLLGFMEERSARNRRVLRKVLPA
jgi:tRNA nucleotidyltransferase (CCA-adding enzyme)